MSALDRPYESLSVGDVYRSQGRTVTEADLIAFASLTGDWHPQHVDAVWSRDTEFGERIAQGLLVLSFVGGLLRLDPEYVRALRGLDAVRFKRPTRIGDTVHLTAKVERLAPVPGGCALVDLEVKIFRHDDALLVRADLRMLWRGAGGARRRREPQLADEPSPYWDPETTSGGPIPF